MNRIFVVDIKFKDGKGELKNCIVFNEGDKLSIQDRDRIHEILESSRIVMFQNARCNGKTHTSNIEEYEIKLVDKESF